MIMLKVILFAFYAILGLLVIPLGTSFALYYHGLISQSTMGTIGVTVVYILWIFFVITRLYRMVERWIGS